MLSPGFDPSTLNGSELLNELGEALAGSPVELDAAIADVVGLPYDQFVKCVVLPQGEFAAFLHAKPAERQEILVRLLGLDVYEKIRDRATTLVTEATAQLAATEPVLADLTAAATDAHLSDADIALKAAQGLTDKVERALPKVATVQEKADAAAKAVAEADQRLALLGLVRPLAGAASLAAAAQQAASRIADAAVAVGAAEEHEEKLRHQLDSGPDAAALTAILNLHEERAKAAARLSTLDKELAKVSKEHAAAEKAFKQAEKAASDAAQAVTAAQQTLVTAQTADRAAWLRRDLVVGHACPVCEQTVKVVPAQPDKPAMAAAKQMLARAEESQGKTEVARKSAERELREVDRRLVTAKAQHEQIASRVSEVDGMLSGAESSDELRLQLKAIEARRKELAEASTALRAAREAHRQAGLAAQQADERLRKAWRDFDSMRDSVAALAPPSPDRDDLGEAWSLLAQWATAQATTLEVQRSKQREALDRAQAELGKLAAAFDALFAEAGFPAPKPGQHQRAAAVAVERATATRERILQMREQAASIRKQRATVEGERQIASALAQHLRANNFEAWLLQEALEALVSGASTILRELTNGQYDLIHDDREFFVVDHYDAGLRRAVRTLSGGETFQASLALALALADQLGGLSSSASLESIMLDEGFGTLDASTLDIVAATLENLAATGDRMVGVVTHVPSLAERIPVRFEITKDARSARVARVG
jgi:exonuclease SbcC